MDRGGSASFLTFIERCDLEGAILTVGGWAFRPGSEIVEIAVVFEGASLVDRVIATGRLSRLDVGERIGPEAAQSGFIATGLVVLEAGDLYLDMHGDDGETTRERLGAFLPHAMTGAPEWVPAGAFPGETPINRYRDLRPAATFARLSASRYAARALRDLRGPATPADEGCTGGPVSILASLFEGASFLPAFFAGLRETTGHDEIILVDNGNTDPAVSDLIVTEAARIPRCRVIRLTINEGYIKGIGAAFAARTVAGHVVVLNSDIALPRGWLPRLCWPLDNLPQVASATPFTNAGTSCSFPVPGIDNTVFLGLDVDTIDAAFQAIDPRRLVVPLPSGVGFCMAMHGAAIAAVGWFDDALFGLGYGEENDWCLRARTLGWRDVLVPNLFVYHKHGGSFPAATKRSLLRRNLETIGRLHPGYFATVSAYFRTDPTAAVRAIVAFRLAQQASGLPARVVTLRLGDGLEPAATAIADGDPLILALFDDDRRTWSALLCAHGFRAQVWGWGADDLAALCALVETTGIDSAQTRRPVHV